jgi:hypothetical protein
MAEKTVMAFFETLDEPVRLILILENRMQIVFSKNENCTLKN